MSGGFSIPFAIAALLLPPDKGRTIFAVLAFVCLWAVVIRLTHKILKLQTAMKPKLSLSVPRGSQEGCYCRMRNETPPFLLFRVAVKNIGKEQITDCKGHLTQVERAGRVVFSGHNILLTFAPEGTDECVSKTIRPGYTEYLDILAVQSDGIRFIGTRSREWPHYFPQLNDIFQNGEQVITLKLSGASTDTLTTKLKLSIGDNFEGSTLEPIDNKGGA